MTPTRRLTALSLLSLSLLGGCKSLQQSSASTSPPAAENRSEAPSDLSQRKNRIAAINSLALLPIDDPNRDSQREHLLAVLCQEIEEASKKGNPEKSLRALEVSLSLYQASELQTPAVESHLRDAARKIYLSMSKQGHELPALFALAVLEQFGDSDDQNFAKGEMEALAEWLQKGEDFARRPTEGLGLERLLEQSSAVFPSPWLTKQLADEYLKTYTTALEAKAPRSKAEKGRLRFTGYLLVRTFLRADDFHSALKVQESLEASATDSTVTERLRLVIEKNDPFALRELMVLFQPQADQTLPPPVLTQGWGITQNLARRLLKIDQKDIEAHLGMARAFRYQELIEASRHHYEQALALADDRFDAWSELSEVYQRTLEQLANDDPEKAEELLPAVEAFHLRAASLWPDRPLPTSLGDAYTTVGAALYDLGRPASSRAIMHKVIQVDPRPEAYDLLGLLAMRDSDYPLAEEYYGRISKLPFDDPFSRINWEVRAKMQLGLAAEKLNKNEQARSDFTNALEKLNTILRLPNLQDEQRAARLGDRATLFFHLGEMELAMSDFNTSTTMLRGRPDTYMSIGLLTATKGYIQQLREVYEQASNDKHLKASAKLYLALWLYDLESRQQSNSDAPEAFLRSFSGNPWGRSLAMHTLGTMPFDDLIAKASNPGERAEAFFYEALRLRRLGKLEDSMASLKKVLETKMVSFYEYRMAQNYLERKGIP